MMKLLKAHDYTVMPWKNGQGTTSQIDIFPSGSSFPGGDFLWRVSSASVASSAPFSRFPDCDRYLTVLQGAGLKLNESSLLPDQIIHFAGEDSIEGSLLKDPVVDLGLIYRRDQIRALMSRLNLCAGETLNLALDYEVSYLYCAQGAFETEALKVSAGDCLKVENLHNLRLVSDKCQDLKIFLIQLSRQYAVSGIVDCPD